MCDIRQGTIRDVHFGMRDFGTVPGLWFTVDFSEHTGTLIVMQGERMEAFLARNHIYKIEDLEGKPCDVQVDGVKCTFVGLTYPARQQEAGIRIPPGLSVSNALKSRT